MHRIRLLKAVHVGVDALDLVDGHLAVPLDDAVGPPLHQERELVLAHPVL